MNVHNGLLAKQSTTNLSLGTKIYHYINILDIKKILLLSKAKLIASQQSQTRYFNNMIFFGHAYNTIYINNNIIFKKKKAQNGA